MDVWFVLLERPEIHGGPRYGGGSGHHAATNSNSSSHGLRSSPLPPLKMRAKVFNMADAYRHLAKEISQRNVPMRLSVAQEREMVRWLNTFLSLNSD